MSAWLVMFRKELSYAKSWMGINIVLLLISVLFLSIFPTSVVKLFVTLLIIYLHMIYLILWSCYTFLKEWLIKTSSHWLNLPHSAWKLLSAKFLVGLFLLMLSFGISLFFMGLSWWSPIIEITDLFGIKIVKEYWGHAVIDWLIADGWKISLFVLINAVSLGAVIMCTILVAKSVKQNGIWVGFGFLVVVDGLKRLLQFTPLYKLLTEWVPLSLSNHEPIEINLNNGELENITYKLVQIMDNFYLGTILFELILTVIFIWISCRLLDQYVEA